MNAYHTVKRKQQLPAHGQGLSWLLVPVLVWTLVDSGAANAQSVYAYPKAGQSQEKQMRDQAECHQWSMQQTGYNPNAPQAPAGGGYAYAPPPKSSSGVFGTSQHGMLGDAARGAGLGAIGGAIAGNAGKGAAIGALAGTLLGGIKRNNQRQEEEAWRQQRDQQMHYQQQQADAARQQGVQRFNQAYAVCMSGRNYQVQ